MNTAKIIDLYPGEVVEVKEPAQKKELDLTFVKLVQRRKNALEYIESVEARRESERVRKQEKTAEIKETLEDIAGAVGIFLMLYGMCIVGSLF